MEIEYRKSVIHQTVGGEDMETEVFLPDFGDGQEQRPICLLYTSPSPRD